MLRMNHRVSRVLGILPAVCTAMVSVAFAAQEAPAAAKANRPPAPLFLTITNGAVNFLAVVNTRTRVTDYVPTGGAGGVTGNAGGVAVDGPLAAAVNFGSGNVTIFVRQGDAMQPTQLIKTASPPVSVAFGHNHLVVLGLTSAESFPVYGTNVIKDADGVVDLLKGDRSAAQIVTYDGGALYVEKSGNVALLNLSTNGFAGISGPSRPVLLPPSPNSDTPFGMVARGANIYLTIAHSNLEVLVVNGQIISSAGGPTPYMDPAGKFLHAPCWNALFGQFLYSADSPGKQLLRYLVSDTNVFFDKPSVARFAGPPTDLAVDGTLMGVIDGGDGITSNASLLDINPEGELQLRFAVKIAGPINGAAIIR
jgi:hypothetical protein